MQRFFSPPNAQQIFTAAKRRGASSWRLIKLPSLARFSTGLRRKRRRVTNEAWRRRRHKSSVHVASCHVTATGWPWDCNEKKEVTRVERDKGTQWGASNFRSVTRTEEKLKTCFEGFTSISSTWIYYYPDEELHAGHPLIDILLIKQILGENCLDRQRKRMPKKKKSAVKREKLRMLSDMSVYGW